MIRGLPARLGALLRDGGVRKYAGNSAWLMLEQFLRAGLNIVVGILVARYLGPAQFGLFNYVVSIMVIVAAVARLGVDGVLVRELIARPSEIKRRLDLGVAFWLMGAGALACSLALLLFLWATGTPAETLTYMALALSLVLVQPFAVIDLFCQAEVKARISAGARILVLLLGTALKAAAVLKGAPLMAFFVITLVEQAAQILLYLVVARRAGAPRFFNRFSALRAREILRSAWPMLITAVAVSINIRVAQVLVNTLMDEHAAGIFAAASRIYEAWIYVPYVCVLSLSPALMNARAADRDLYYRRIVLLTRLLFWVSAALALFFALAGGPFIALTFGEAFREAHLPLALLMASAAPAAIGSVTGRYFVFERREGAFARRTLLAAGLNIGLSLLLIPPFGASGAALGVLLSLLVANYGLLWADGRDAAIRGAVHRAVLFR